MGEKSIRTMRLVTLAFILFLLQVAVVNRFSVNWGRPALLCLLAGFLALYGPMPSLMWYVLGVGLLRDFGSDGRLGISALAVLPATAVVLAFRNRFYRGGALDVALLLIFMLIVSCVEGLGSSLLGDVPPVIVFGRIGLGQSFLTAALAFPFFFLVEHLGIVTEADNRAVFAK